MFTRELEQYDYENNERLTKYFVSYLGHTAVNVNGSIFNFSHLMNENEIMGKEEYFYRPALSEFAPSPNNCATIIRDVFNQCGFPEITGRFPRDLFVNTTYHLFCHPELDVQYEKLPQLFVPEAPMSTVSPLLNFLNYFRKNELRIFESS